MFKQLLGAVVALLLLTTSQAQHEGEGEAAGVSESTTITRPCARPLEDLRASIEDVFPENYTVYLNCISFDAKGELRTAIASGDASGQADLRYTVECRSEVLIALPSTITVTTIDRTNVETGCLNCSDTLTNSCGSGKCTVYYSPSLLTRYPAVTE